MTDQCNLRHIFPGDFDRARPAIAILDSFRTANFTDLLSTWELDCLYCELVSSPFTSAPLSKPCRNSSVLARLLVGIPERLGRPLDYRGNSATPCWCCLRKPRCERGHDPCIAVFLLEE